LGIGFSNDVLLLVTMITAKIFFRYDSKVSKKLFLTRFYSHTLLFFYTWTLLCDSFVSNQENTA